MSAAYAGTCSVLSPADRLPAELGRLSPLRLFGRGDTQRAEISPDSFKAGPNKLHFSGRLKGRKLAKGNYTLEALQSNGGGRELVALDFAIKG